MAWEGTGDAERLMVIEDSTNLRPSGWSPDGALLFEYSTTASISMDIGMLSLEGDGTWEPLLATEADEQAPAISPDGQWIAYVSDRTGDREIYVQRFPELGGEQLISRGGGTYPVWSQSGRDLFYATRGGAVRVMPVESGPNLRAGIAEILLTNAGEIFRDGIRRHWDVSPDGQRLLALGRLGAVTGEADSPLEINIVLNWFEELLERVPIP